MKHLLRSGGAERRRAGRRWVGRTRPRIPLPPLPPLPPPPRPPMERSAAAALSQCPAAAGHAARPIAAAATADLQGQRAERQSLRVPLGLWQPLDASVANDGLDRGIAGVPHEHLQGRSRRRRRRRAAARRRGLLLRGGTPRRGRRNGRGTATKSDVGGRGAGLAAGAVRQPPAGRGVQIARHAMAVLLSSGGGSGGQRRPTATIRSGQQSASCRGDVLLAIRSQRRARRGGGPDLKPLHAAHEPRGRPSADGGGRRAAHRRVVGRRLIRGCAVVGTRRDGGLLVFRLAGGCGAGRAAAAVGRGRDVMRRTTDAQGGGRQGGGVRLEHARTVA